MNTFRRSWTYWVAVGFGSGLLRPAPGTWGSLWGFLTGFLLLSNMAPSLFVWFWVGMFLLGVFVCTQASDLFGVADHPSIVWDEIVAAWLLCFILPLTLSVKTLVVWFVAFVAFRCFDILKPWPVSWCDQRIHGGWGIMLDDVCAALLAAPVIWLCCRILA